MISNAGNTKHHSLGKHTFAVTVKYPENGRFRVARHDGVMLNGNLPAAIEILLSMSRDTTNMLNHGAVEEQRSQKGIGAYHNKFL